MLFKFCAGKSSGICVVNWHNNSEFPLAAAHSQQKKSDIKLSVKQLVGAYFHSTDEIHAVQRDVF